MRLTLPAVAAFLSVITVAAQSQSPSAEAGRITGHVVTGYAELIADATVTVASVDQRISFQTRTTRTDSTGSFSFAGLPAGSYRLSATKPGYTSRQLADGGVASATFEVGPAVDLAADAHADVQVAVRRTAGIAGRVIRPDGSAAPDTRVGVASRSRPLPLLDTMTTSQYDGRYEIEGLPPGEYVVVAMPDMRRTGSSVDSVSFQSGIRASSTDASPSVDRLTWYPGVAEETRAGSVTVLEGIDAEGIDIWLTPAQRFNVSGRVFWPVGTVAENIVIDYGDPAGTSNGVWLVSDPGGLFTIAGIAPGSLTLLVRADSVEGTLIGMASTEVTMDSVEDVRIVVDRPGRVAGRIVYEGDVPSSGRATSIVAVQKLLKVSALYPVPESTVDASGRFVFPGLVGEYELALDGLQQGLAIKRVIRNGRSLPANRIGVSGGEDIRDIEVVVGR